MNNKNIYICSTVRHLLFSLYKSHDSSTHSVIVFFYDYQDIDPDSLNINELPDNIEIILVSRNSLVNEIKRSGLIGRYILFSSLHGLAISKSIKFKLVDLLHNKSIILDIEGTTYKLFLFNDNNKMSRLFRLLFKSYSIIEDGMGNYIEHKIHSKSKQAIRFLSNKNPRHHVFGEKNQCNEIHVVHPDKLPKSVFHKGKKLTLSRDVNIISSIRNCFIFDNNVELDNKSLIIATQPTFNKIKSRLKDSQFFLRIYDSIISKSKEHNLNPVLKLHPKENKQGYQQLKDKGVVLLSNKIPLEIYLLSSVDKVNVISINSSVGIGMEDHCNIYKLIPDSEISNFEEIIIEFESNNDSLEDAISLQLSNII
ncbi:glycosyltransferase family 52 [Vibrio splendidus]|uniref:glycosyltransferase family 52 n=1 Tax=Vibrio splendidus TaxID=29497 RepID=UPI000D39AF3B|nr:glycosyltransferase family 52 [Vibrio splendidus]MCC4881710.1 glycosyltransferase family 52 protein [Vibrio splendidus]PTP38698.1 hypothetical protein CWN83_25135 [Vibrio splendidus]PTP98299.1 hypothetical protein CWO34_12565 [Vibrio splendidus]